MNFKKSFLNIFLSFLLPTLNAWASDGSEYYPLGIGKKWVYESAVIAGGTFTRITTVKEFDRQSHLFTISTDQFTTRQGQTVNFNRGSDIQVKPDGVYQVSSWNWMKPNKKEASNKLLLKFPIKVGTTWTHKDSGPRGSMTEKNTIIRIVDVAVKSGRYSNVAVVQVDSRIMMDGKLSVTKGAMYLYYAPNIGLIKEEYTNTITHEIMLMDELVEFTE